MEGEDIFLWYKNQFQDIRNLNVDLKNKNLYLILEGERVYIKLLTVPKVPVNELYKIIKYELKYYFNNMEEILFHYHICDTTDKNYKVMVFCINSTKLDKLKNLLDKEKKLKLVNLIQFAIFEYVKDKVKSSKYALIFIYNDNLYILAVENEIIVYSSIIKNFIGDQNEFLLELKRIESFDNKIKGKYDIYTLWFPYNNIIEQLKEDYNCKILDYKEEVIMRKLIKDWKCRRCIR